MKIGILTQPLIANYGGILQNYALQTVLKRMGHEVWTIDYGKFTWCSWLDNAWRVMAHKILGHDVKFSRTPTERKLTEKPLRSFAGKNISLTFPRTKYVKRRIVKQYGFNGIVVGSDQVWRPMYNSRLDRMFLSFCNNVDIRRIAYAASFGTDEWEYNAKLTKKCAILAQRFDAISVRESSGVALCREHFNVKASHVLDPTLLLTSNDYSNLCTDIPRQKPFVFAYILDPNEEKIHAVKSFANNKGMTYLIQSADTGVNENDSIELWLSHFRDASHVITDSFHGTVFSIIFNRHFFVFSNKKRGSSRFDSLLGLFGLQDRLQDSEIVTDSEIDWKSVNNKITEERLKSVSWLKDALE